MSDRRDSSQSGVPWHLLLFVASACTLFAAGLIAAELEPFDPSGWTPGGLLEASSYALWTLAIVAAHEAGHYVTARRRGVEVSAPYFLPGIGPIPGLGIIPFFGTFGAFIRMKWDRLSAADLSAVAGWGPVAGFAATVPAVVIGVAMSEPTVVAGSNEMLILGDSLLMIAATELVHPDMGDGMELMLHPIGLAGWVGCLLTALNLLPLGQLDGGHLLYSVFGQQARGAVIAAFIALVGAGIFVFAGWLVVALLVVVTGMFHPPMIDTGDRSSSLWMALGCLLIFGLTFTPAPVVVDDMALWSYLW